MYNPLHGSLAGEVPLAAGLRLPTAFKLHADGGLAAEAKLYCDDVGMAGRSWLQAAEAQVAYAHVTRDNGIVMSYPKSEGPSQRLPMLGLGVDVSHEEEGFTVFIPAKKRAELLKLLRLHRHSQWGPSKGFDTRRTLCSLVSKLYWTVPACPAAADQCREMWDVCYAGVDINSHCINFEAKVRLTGVWRAAALWWERLLANPAFKGETRRSTGRHKIIYGWSDASGSLAKAGAWGATIHMRDDTGQEHQGQASADFKGSDIPKHSTFKEMRGVEEQLKLLTSSEAWRERARGARMIAHTDCQPVACAVAKRRAHAVALRPLIRRIRALCATLDVQLETRWLHGTRLIAQGCDSGSRADKQGVGVFAEDAPDADTFLPSCCLASQWSPELGAALAEWSGKTHISFDPAAWDQVPLLQQGVVLAPRANDTRRCIATALDAVRSHEFELGLTVVAVDSVPSPWKGMRKYFSKQLLVSPGQLGLSADEAVGVWFLQLEPKTKPAIGGMPRESVEERVEGRWRAGVPIDDFALLDSLTTHAIAADVLHADATRRCSQEGTGAGMHGVRSAGDGTARVPVS